MGRSERLIALKTTLPHTPPPAAVLLPEDEAQTRVVWGDEIPPDAQGQVAIAFMQERWEMSLAVTKVRSREGVPLTLDLHLALKLVDPHRFWLDVMQRGDRLTEAQFRVYLEDLARRGIGRYCEHKSLAELNRPGVREEVEGRLLHYLHGEGDLRNRSGLELLSLALEGIRFPLQGVGEATYTDVYLAHSLPASRRGRVEVAESQVLREVQEAAKRTAGLRPLLRMPSSISRPERWRHSLGQRVVAAPLVHGERLYVATEDGAVWAFARAADDEEGRERWQIVWDPPARLPTRLRAGMVIAAQTLWVPGENGILYGLRLSDGHVVWEVEIGGRLRSAPTVVGDALYIATDRPKAAFTSEGGGRLVKVDPWTGGIVKEMAISSRGFRGRPVPWGEFLFLSDRRNVVYRVDRHLEHVEAWRLEKVGRLLAGVTVDEAHRRIIVVDGAPGYGWVIALDIRGQEQARTRLPGTVINPPLVWKGYIFVPVSGQRGRGYLFRLDPLTLEQVGEPAVTDGPVTASPVGFEDIVIFGAHDGLVYALWVDSGKLFWRAHSGHRVLAPPAVSEDGFIFVADEGGNISALPWYGTNPTEAARWCGERGRVEEAARLWEEAGDAEAAMEMAEEKARWGLAAEIARRYGYYERAAGYYEKGAEALKRRGRARQAALWWQQAAEMWEEVGEEEKRYRCLQEAALAVGWPVLQINLLNRPQVRAGQMTQVELGIRNEGGGPAEDVVVEISGSVHRAERKVLPGVIERNQRRQVTLSVYPTEGGMARLLVCARYRVPDTGQELEVRREIILAVEREPVVQYHYHGPHVRIGGDGVVILRGEPGEVQADIAGDGVVIGRPRGRRIDLQAAEEGEQSAVPLGGEPRCPRCGAAVSDDYRFCATCGYELRE